MTVPSQGIRVKICGLTKPEDASAVALSGAAYAGLVFVEKSRRYVSLERARALAVALPPGVAKVSLTVDADDATLDAIVEAVPIDMLQLHGEETPNRVQAVKARYGLPVMKAVGVADASDLAQVDGYARVADQILVDAKPTATQALPGGNGAAFDWSLLSGRRWTTPWMLAGGLRPETVMDAIQQTGARQVDVSSGVESSPGCKDPVAIAHFVVAAQAEDQSDSPFAQGVS